MRTIAEHGSLFAGRAQKFARRGPPGRAHEAVTVASWKSKLTAQPDRILLENDFAC